MKLKSLEMQGFKSFPDRTRLEFNDGFTVVVGPNGSGKSNISDAIRWVMGEQSSKTLRGAKMEDVIFIGTQSRKAQGFAQVALTFDNTDRSLEIDSDEVVIARKYYRSGESEYLLNGENVRLADISEILMDTGLSREGYSIIGQGRIDEIVSAKSTDRRRIFEEAAGITKYRYRKKEATKKLELANENLVRLTDILGELESRVGPLKEQSEKARRFKELDAKKEQYEISLWTVDLAGSKQSLREQEDKIFAARAAYEQQEQQLQTLSDQLQELYDGVQQRQLEVERVRKQKEDFMRELSEQKTYQAVLQGDVSHANESVERIKKEKNAFSLSGGELEQEIAKRKEEFSALQKQLSLKKEEIEQARSQLIEWSEQQSHLFSNYDEVVAQFNEQTLAHSAAVLNITSFTSQTEQITHRLEEIAAQVAQTAGQQEDAVSESCEVQKLLDEISERMSSLKNVREGYQSKHQMYGQKLDHLQADLNQVSKAISERMQRVHILNELEQAMEGFDYSVRKVLSASRRGSLSGVHGTIAQLIDLPEQYTVAIETALGRGLQNIVVEDETSAKQAIRMLSEQRAGRATFLPLTSVHGNRLQKPGVEQCQGYVGIAADLITYDARYEGVLTSLLGRTVVASDLDCAVEIAKKFRYSFLIVTLDGQRVNAGGSLTGGSRTKSAGLLSRKNEILELKKQAEQDKVKQQTLENQHAQLLQKAEKISAQLKGIDSELQVCSEDQIRYQGEQKRLQESADHFSDQKSALEKERLKYDAQLKSLQRELKQTKQTLEQAETSLTQLEQQKGDLHEQREAIRSKRHELEDAIHSADIEYNGLMSELEHLQELIEDFNQRAQGNQTKLKELDEELKKQKQLIAEKQAEIDQIQAQHKESDTKQQEFDREIERVIQRRMQQEQQSNLMRKQEKEHQDAKETFGRQLARLEEQKVVMQRDYDGIISKMWESYGVTVSEAQQRATEFDDVGQAKKELISLKGEIKSLGTVNLGAIEEYEEVSKRYEFLNQQVSDAQNSADELKKMIHTLTVSMQDMFIKAFHEINRRFQTIFVELFGGGHAQLLLEDTENVLECGIQIEVQPPGKIIKNLSALSGGEKAFIAIAIYFAIIKVRPAPFCVLDEIEAALDDVNVDRFASYIKNIDKNTQFIVITHRRGTMEQANTLYGVTMQEEGVSKLLQLRIDQATHLAAT